VRGLSAFGRHEMLIAAIFQFNGPFLIKNQFITSQLKYSGHCADVQKCGQYSPLCNLIVEILIKTLPADQAYKILKTIYWAPKKSNRQICFSMAGAECL
jgi:hypothetical protein